MRFGAHYLPTYVPELDGTPHQFYQTMYEQMEALDRLGYDYVWVTEHHFHHYGGMIPDPATFLASVAGRTSRIRLGIAIVVLPLHNPLQVAESYAMVDVISNGRLEFGVGRGSSGPEFEGFGMTQADSAIRMKEGMEIIRRGWSGEKVEFHGEVFTVGGVEVLPPTVQRPHPPIWVAANRSDDTFRWAGSNGYHLMTLPPSYPPAVLREQIERYKIALAHAGADPTTREVLGKFHIYVAETDAQAEREAAGYLENYGSVSRGRSSIEVRRDPAVFRERLESGHIIAGTPERCIEHIHRWRDLLGLTVVSGTFHFGGMPQELALKNIQLFADEVMPAFREPALHPLSV